MKPYPTARWSILLVSLAIPLTALSGSMFIGSIMKKPDLARLNISLHTNGFESVMAKTWDNPESVASRHDTFVDLLKYRGTLSKEGLFEPGQQIRVYKIEAHLNGWQSFTNFDQVVSGCPLYTYVLCGLTRPEDSEQEKQRYAAFVTAVKQKTTAINNLNSNILNGVNLFCVPSPNGEDDSDLISSTNVVTQFDFKTARNISKAVLPSIPAEFQEKVGQNTGPFLLTVGAPLKADQNGTIIISRPLLIADLSIFKEPIFRQFVTDYENKLHAGVQTDNVEVFESRRSVIANTLVLVGEDAKQLLAQITAIVQNTKAGK